MKKLFSLILIILFISCDDSKNTYYEIQENKVIYHYVKRLGQNFYTATFHTKEIKNTDIASFEILNEYYAKDKYKIYFEGKELKDRNVETFKLLKNQISIDRNSAYYKNRVIKGSDGLSFENLNSFYARDKNNIYFRNIKEYTKIDNVDLESFSVLNDYEYAIDKDIVYYKGISLKKSNPKHFKVLRYYYSKDNSSIYFKSEIVTADVNSFYVLDKGYAKDFEKIYYQGKALNTHYATFKITEGTNVKNGLAEDKNYFYNGIVATKK